MLPESSKGGLPAWAQSEFSEEKMWHVHAMRRDVRRVISSERSDSRRRSRIDAGSRRLGAGVVADGLHERTRPVRLFNVVDHSVTGKLVHYPGASETMKDLTVPSAPFPTHQFGTFVLVSARALHFESFRAVRVKYTLSTRRDCSQLPQTRCTSPCRRVIHIGGGTYTSALKDF